MSLQGQIWLKLFEVHINTIHATLIFTVIYLHLVDFYGFHDGKCREEYTLDGMRMLAPMNLCAHPEGCGDAFSALWTKYGLFEDQERQAWFGSSDECSYPKIHWKWKIKSHGS